MTTNKFFNEPIDTLGLALSKGLLKCLFPAYNNAMAQVSELGKMNKLCPTAITKLACLAVAISAKYPSYPMPTVDVKENGNLILVYEFPSKLVCYDRCEFEFPSDSDPLYW